MNLIRNNWILT